MAAQGLTAVLLVLTFLAAGCIGGQEAPVNSADVVNNTEVNNTRNGHTLIALQETNKTEMGAGGVDHQHDYWAGRERAPLFEAPVMMTPMGAGNAAGYQAVADVEIPQGHFVFEGTAKVEFTITNPQRHACARDAGTLNGYYICTDTINNLSAAPSIPAQADPTGGPTTMKLRYKHASTVKWIDAGPLSWGKPLSIEIRNPLETDMPHATATGWAFEVVSADRQDSTLEFTARAEIVKGVGDIPLWPGHPNFYAESPSRVVLDSDGLACDTNQCVIVGEDKAAPLSAQRLISYGTRTLYVYLNVTSVNAPNPATAPTNWFLYHSNSTGRTNITNPFDDTKHPLTKKEHMWVLPVDDNGMDSPYGDGSKWQFALGGALKTPVVSCYGGCADWSAKYHITVVATNKELDLKEYDMQCLRGDYCPKPTS